MQLSDQALAQSVIELGAFEDHLLGPSLALHECTVRNAADAQALEIAGLRMEGGRFEQLRPLADFHFENGHFHAVTFVGRFIACDFGDWDSEARSSIDACDFSHAYLDGCRFLRCDKERIRFPRWPCFTVTAPAQGRRSVLERHWPDGVLPSLARMTDADADCVAVTADAQRIVRQTGVAPDRLRSLLESLPGILIRD